MNITFWKDNKSDGEHQVSAEKIVDDFIKSDIYENYKAGWPFERALLSHMMIYGSYETITDENWDNLYKQLKGSQNESN